MHWESICLLLICPSRLILDSMAAITVQTIFGRSAQPSTQGNTKPTYTQVPPDYHFTSPDRQFATTPPWYVPAPASDIRPSSSIVVCLYVMHYRVSGHNVYHVIDPQQGRGFITSCQSVDEKPQYR
jgi:hypothetical protein